MADRCDELGLQFIGLQCLFEGRTQIAHVLATLGDVAAHRKADAAAVDFAGPNVDLDRERRAVFAQCGRFRGESLRHARKERLNLLVDFGCADLLYSHAEQLVARVAVGFNCGRVRLDDLMRLIVDEEDQLARVLGKQRVAHALRAAQTVLEHLTLGDVVPDYLDAFDVVDRDERGSDVDPQPRPVVAAERHRVQTSASVPNQLLPGRAVFAHELGGQVDKLRADELIVRTSGHLAGFTIGFADHALFVAEQDSAACVFQKRRVLLFCDVNAAFEEQGIFFELLLCCAELRTVFLQLAIRTNGVLERRHEQIENLLFFRRNRETLTEEDDLDADGQLPARTNCAIVQYRPYATDEMVFVVRFGQEVVGSGFKTADDVHCFAERRHEHDGDITRRFGGFDLAAKLVSGHLGHDDVGDDEVDRILFEDVECCNAIRCDDDLPTLRFEDRAKLLGLCRAVFNDK